MANGLVDRPDHRRRKTDARQHANHDRDRADRHKQQCGNAKTRRGCFCLSLLVIGLQLLKRVEKIAGRVVTFYGADARDEAALNRIFDVRLKRRAAGDRLALRI